MDLAEYAAHDATGLAALVARGDVHPAELARTAAEAIARADPSLGAVVETYPDMIDALDAGSLGAGAFRGVPFLIKDAGEHLLGRRTEFGSRLAAGMIAQTDSHLARLFREAGLVILGRSNAPEYSISGTTENALYGATSTPWRQGHSAGGSTGGGMAAVAAGLVPIAHGSDIAGSIRIPASFCGGVGLKPSRGRISAGPERDEGGFGLAMNFVQTRSVRDAARMLDCLAVPQTGDPFPIPAPGAPWAEAPARDPGRLRIALSTAPLMDAPVDPEVAEAVRAVATTLQAMGHEVVEAVPDFDAKTAARRLGDIWFFGFDLLLDGFAARTGRTVGPDTLEPVTLRIYEHAKRLGAAEFFAAHAYLNIARRRVAAIFDAADLWLTPTTAQVAFPHGLYHQGMDGIGVADWIVHSDGPLQFTFPHNLMGTPAISLPLAMHSSGLPIGVQIGARPAREDLLLSVAARLEEALPWADRIPPLHVSRF